MDNLEGGFLIHKTPAILTSHNRHTSNLPGRPVSEYDLEATNLIQASPWRVNRRVLDVARRLLADGIRTPLVPSSAPVPVPGRMPDDVWAQMDDGARKAHRARIAQAHAENASLAGQYAGFVEALTTAGDMENLEAFWFPWTHDFRLRRYPVACGGLSPQGNDLSRNLMMFAEGKRLGPAGLYWLAIRLANAMGQDKMPLDERWEWAMNRAHIWESVAHDPLGRLSEWQDADSPWEALATIFEIAEAIYTPTDFVSHLPVQMDGSCNGLQHLSAMGLDPVGAFATNLTASAERQDVYLQVAAKCRELVERDAARGIPAALLWLGKVDRNTVKRAVLATPYGVTDAGIQRQLVEDKKVPKSETVTVKEASAYFRDVLVSALSDTVVAAKTIMAWLQACGMRMAEAGLPLVWETPTGSTIQQAYRVPAGRRVATLVGQVQLLEEADGGLLAARKQALGSAPNVVHSFDAAHLARTVVSLGRGYGIRSFSMIHDSFGVHACDTPTLHAVLRSEFVQMYQTDWLARLAQGFNDAAPGVDLPMPPPRGTFDITEVLRSPFFFA